MSVAIAELDDLVLDRGTIARTDTLDLAGIERGAGKIVADDPMGLRARARHPAFDLRIGDPGREVGEGNRVFVRRLALDALPVDRLAVEPRRRSGLEPPEPQTQTPQRRRQPRRGILAHSPGGNALCADMDEAGEKGACRQHDRPTGDPAAIGEDHGGDGAVLANIHVEDVAFDDGQTLVLGDPGLHGRAIELAVGLGAGPAHGRALAPIEEAKLDARGIGDLAHEATQRIHFAHEMALADPADRRIAAHRPDRLEAMGDEEGRSTEARGRARRLAAGMAAANDDNIGLRRKKPVGVWIAARVRRIMRGHHVRPGSRWKWAASEALKNLGTCRQARPLRSSHDL